jgi:hypothetical protein
MHVKTVYETEHKHLYFLHIKNYNNGNIQHFEVVSNFVGICTSGNYAEKWIIKQ